MSDFNPSNDPPSVAVQVIAALARHILTAAAGALGTAGVLTTDQQTQFVSLGAALALGGVSYAWSVIQKRNLAKKR